MLINTWGFQEVEMSLSLWRFRVPVDLTVGFRVWGYLSKAPVKPIITVLTPKPLNCPKLNP